MVGFVAHLQAAQTGNGVFHRRLFHQHLLETALQCGVFFDVLAVFVQGGGANAVQLATCQRRLEHIARVHGTFGLACADHGVDFVDEQDDAALFLGHVIEHGFEALFKLTAVLGTGQQACHVQHQHALVLEGFRHFAFHNALCQTFHDGGLAHTGFTDEHGVVLAAALQHLNGAANFVVTANHGVELAHAGALGQV